MSWMKEMRESLRDVSTLQSFLETDLNLSDGLEKKYPVFIPFKLAHQIKMMGPNSSLWKQFIPSFFETVSALQSSGMIDPIGDQRHSSIGKIVHRYQNRVLFFPTTHCPVQCRYCFRKNELHSDEEKISAIFDGEDEFAFRYIENHTEINEIIFSGGDPLVLSNQKINHYLNRLSKIKHIHYVRFHTRIITILPSRIDLDFIELIKNHQSNFKQIIIVAHLNHYDELYSEAKNAFSLLRDHQIKVLSQSVLLKGINNSSDVLVELFNQLAELSVIPYYLHHPDQAKGAMHFYLSLEEGRRIYLELRSKLPGWMIPQYMIDVPGGEGKIWAFNPETFEFKGEFLSSHKPIVDDFFVT